MNINITLTKEAADEIESLQVGEEISVFYPGSMKMELWKMTGEREITVYTI